MIFFDAEKIGPWVADRIGMAYVPGSASAIGRKRAGELIAGVLYMDFNGVNVFCHIAGDGRNWMSREFLRVIFAYPFEQLKAHRITVCVDSNNRQSRRFVEHLGFEREATLSHAVKGGDLIVYRMMAAHCRWLGDLHHG